MGIASKGTISYWLHGLVLTESAKKLLEKNTELSYRRGLFKANKIRSEKIKSENISYFAVGENKIKRLSKTKKNIRITISVLPFFLKLSTLKYLYFYY